MGFIVRGLLMAVVGITVVSDERKTNHGVTVETSLVN